jgi:molybdate transport system substrate-binding protein
MAAADVRAGARTGGRALTGRALTGRPDDGRGNAVTASAIDCFVLSGGAAQAVVTALQPAFESSHGCRLVAHYGAVGTMRDRLLAGAPCDVVVLTASLIAALVREGRVDGDSARPLGSVATGIAVTGASTAQPVIDGPALAALLQAATALYVPDLQQSTAGIHIAAMLDRLGLRAALAGRIREFPNGATAMRELGRDGGAAIGITQVTEILFTDGVRLLGELPVEHGLRTVYTAAVARSAGQPGLALRLVEALTGAESAALRQRSGFTGFDPGSAPGR